jgi:hypothetical protein
MESKCRGRFVLQKMQEMPGSAAIFTKLADCSWRMAAFVSVMFEICPTKSAIPNVRHLDIKDGAL